MRPVQLSMLLPAILAAALGCNNAPGPDSLSSHEAGAGGGGGITNCVSVCHTPGGAVGPDPLATNGTGTAGKHVAHVTSRGMSCLKCHFNYDTNLNHFNGIVNSRGVGPAPVIFDAANPSGLWTYVTPSGPGTCASTICHQGLTPDWYGTVVPPLDTVCANCHGAAVGALRQVTGAAGDFATNPSVTSHHVAGAADPTPAQCTVCHDQSMHMGGTVRLTHADTGTGIVYDPAAPATLEPFCLSCHDSDSAGGNTSPFGDGQNLGAVPYTAGITIASSWSGSSAHRSRGLSCLGTGAPGTGCHGRSGSVNAHGSVNSGLLANGMNFMIPVVTEATYSADPLGSSYSYGNYRLCFECHDADPGTQASVGSQAVLGFFTGGIYDIFPQRSPFNVRQQSLFRDYYNGTASPFYSDTMWEYPYMALHNYHLIGFESRSFIVPPGVNALAWNYRGDTARRGRITCTACHNVHGTVGPTIRSTHAELGLALNVNGGDLYVTLGTPSMLTAPMSCAYDCHGQAGQTSYWHTPARE